MGQVIHDKFIVIDFNDENPVVFSGSSNLAQGGEQQNGDNLLAIYDPIVAHAFAIEAMRLVDHYQFRASLNKADDAHPLMLSSDGAHPWFDRDYDPASMYYTQRQLLALGPSGEVVSAIAANSGGIMDAPGITSARKQNYSQAAASTASRHKTQSGDGHTKAHQTARVKSGAGKHR